MAIRLKKSHAVAVAVVGMLLTYQNCAQVGTEGMDASSYDDGLPFAYDAKPDTLAYMSCSEISANMAADTTRRAYFSFRMGGYTPYFSGVTLNADYRRATAAYTPEVRAQTLAGSALSGNTRLSLSFRQKESIQTPWFESPGLKTSIDGFLPAMDSAEVAGPLSAKQTSANYYTNYFPSANTKRLMEASLNVLAAEADADALRTNLESSSGSAATYLVMGYSGSSDEMDMSLRVPAGATKTVAYGLGFQPSFGVPAGTSTGARRVMTGLSEIDLTSGRARNANWQCLPDYQFMIVRPEDAYANTSLCARQPDPPVEQQSDALKIIRRVLRAEDWYVDMTKRCVVPKDTGDLCYGGATTNRTISYRQAGCTTAVNSTTTCAHWVSVCVRP